MKRIFLLLCLFPWAQPAGAAIVTYAMTGYVYQCVAPCVFGPNGDISVTIDTDVTASASSPANAAIYQNAVTQIVIGSFVLNPLTSTTSVTDNYSTGTKLADQIAVSFDDGTYRGQLAFQDIGDIAAPPTWLTSKSLPDSFDGAKIDYFYGHVLSQSDTTLEWVLSVNTIPPAVPEMASWAMLLLGFSGIGLLAYRRHQGAVGAA